jgi:pre-mRNA-splicing factor ISY1
MARNSEKAMTALARWRQLQLKEQGKLRVDRRPHLASEETNVKKAEKWRYQVVREIAKKVAQIQNAGLGEYKIRDLNDEINKLLREKSHWEDRVKELGGIDFKKTAPKMLDNEGKEVPGNRGYKYFGAAKDLPGVRELFDQEPPISSKKHRGEMMRNIDADYYGYMDDDDGLLVPVEEKCEKEAIRKKIEQWKNTETNDVDVDEVFVLPEMNSDDEDYVAGRSSGTNVDVTSKDHVFIAHVPVPSQKDVRFSSQSLMIVYDWFF